MARFIQAEFPTEHAGVARVSRGFAAIAAAIRSFDGARGTATLLLAALVSTLLVVANQLITTWTEGHLLAAWIVSWLVAFAALALFAAPARRAAGRIRSGLNAWAAARKQAAEDEKLWSIAMTDARVMADLSRAMGKQASTYRDLRGYY
jgi:hypothetical protein